MVELANTPALHAGDLHGSSGSEPRRGHLLYIIGGIVAKVQRSKPRKRGPKEERLVITDNPADALSRLLRKQPSKRPAKPSRDDG